MPTKEFWGRCSECGFLEKGEVTWSHLPHLDPSFLSINTVDSLYQAFLTHHKETNHQTFVLYPSDQEKAAKKPKIPSSRPLTPFENRQFLTGLAYVIVTSTTDRYTNGVVNLHSLFPNDLKE